MVTKSSLVVIYTHPYYLVLFLVLYMPNSSKHSDRKELDESEYRLSSAIFAMCISFSFQKHNRVRIVELSSRQLQAKFPVIYGVLVCDYLVPPFPNAALEVTNKMIDVL